MSGELSDKRADRQISPSARSGNDEGRRRPTVRLDTPGSPERPPLFGADVDPSATARATVAGRRLGRYELLLEMGSGGMATLFLARMAGPRRFEKLVAIKKIHDHLTSRQDFVDMFLDEAQISARIQHPNVVQLFDLGEADGSYFIAMEYVHGVNLAGLLRAVSGRGSSLYGWPQAAWMVAEAAAGLHAAHELLTTDGRPMNLVHRDVSPQNILVSYDGNVKVADFGIAFAAERITHTSSGVLKGKIPYMAPEQASGEPLDRRADVFALGTLLFESVCLRRLFKEPSEAASLNRVIRADVVRPRAVNPQLPQGLEEIILRALERERGRRFQTAAELSHALRELLSAQRAPVDAPQIAAVLGELFSDQKQRLDTRISEVTQSRVAPAAPAPVDLPAPPPGAEQETSSVERPAGAGSRRALLVTALLAVFVLTTAVVAFLAWPRDRRETAAATDQEASPRVDMPAGRRETPAPRTSASASPARPPAPQADPMGAGAMERAPAAGRLLVRFKVLPRRAAATIHFRGKTYHQNRLQLLVEPAAREEEVRVVAPGYRPLTRVVLVARGARLSYELRLRRRRRSRPREGAMRSGGKGARSATPPARPRGMAGPMVPVPAMLSLE